MSKIKPTDYWETPKHIFDQLNAEHGPIELDVCANVTNHKVLNYYTEYDDALHCSWTEYAPPLLVYEGMWLPATEQSRNPVSAAWMNPPYSDPGPWIKKASEEGRRGAKVVAFLKADHTTQAYKNYIFDYKTMKPYPGVTIIPWPARVKFVAPPGLLNKQGKPVKSCTATFPNIVVIFQQP